MPITPDMINMIKQRAKAEEEIKAKKIAKKKKSENKVFDFSTISVNPDGSSQRFANDPENPNAGQGYLIVEPKGTDNLVQFVGDAGQAARAFIDAYYKTFNGINIERLKADLLSAGYINAAEIKANDYLPGLNNFLQNYTRHTIQDINLGGATGPVSMSAFLADKKNSISSGSKPSINKIITTRRDAKKDLDADLMDLLGRPSTEEEENAYYKALHTAENASVQTTTDGITVGRVLQPADRLLIVATVAKKALKGTDADELLTSNKGTSVALDIAELQSTASDYGIKLSATQALKYVRAALGSPNGLEKQKERIKQTAITIHPYLKEHFAAGGNYSDIATEYATAKFNKLGTLVRDPMLDKDIKDAIANGENINSFETRMQGKTEWGFTPEAHQYKTQFANTILSSFGFGG